MDQQLRASRWPYYAILACLLAIYAILPVIKGRDAHELADTSQQPVEIFPNTNTVICKVDVFPPDDDINPSPLETGSLYEAATVKPCAAILSEVPDSNDANEETADSISSESSEPGASSESSAPETLAVEKEKKTEKKVVEPLLIASGLSSPAQSMTGQSAPDAKPTSALKESSTKESESNEPATKESETLVANLPKITNLPAEAIKPDSLGKNYPSTGLEQLKPLGPSHPERFNSAQEQSSLWTEPASLLSLLDEIGKSKQLSDWAAETIRLVHELGPAITGGSDQAGAILDRLADSRLEAQRLADSTADLPLARKFRQASYAIERRLEVWREVDRLGTLALVEKDKPKPDAQRMSMCLAEIDNLTKNSAEGRQWRKYLLVNALKELSLERSASESRANEQRKLTQQVLAQFDRNAHVRTAAAVYRHGTDGQVLRGIAALGRRLPDLGRRVA